MSLPVDAIAPSLDTITINHDSKKRVERFFEKGIEPVIEDVKLFRELESKALFEAATRYAVEHTIESIVNDFTEAKEFFEPNSVSFETLQWLGALNVSHNDILIFERGRKVRFNFDLLIDSEGNASSDLRPDYDKVAKLLVVWGAKSHLRGEEGNLFREAAEIGTISDESMEGIADYYKSHTGAKSQTLIMSFLDISLGLRLQEVLSWKKK